MRLIDADALWFEIIHYMNYCDDILELIEKMPTVPQWIPFKTRPLTEEEKEDHPELDCVLDCKLPDDGQAILVSINVRGHERVQYDEYYTDDGSYLDSGYEIGTEAEAWMPLPEPYKGETKAKEEIQKNCIGHVYTLEEFAEEVDEGYINSNDGCGYFHDGDNETNISVWTEDLTLEEMKKYPYVCWYNK